MACEDALMLLITTLALAQEADTIPLEEAVEPGEPERLQEELNRLQSELEASKAGSARAVALDAMLVDVALAQDPREDLDVRAAAMTRMANRAEALDEQELARQLLLGAAQDRNLAVQSAAVEGLTRLGAVEELEWLVGHGRPIHIAHEAVVALEGLGTPEAGQALFWIATGEQAPRELRMAAQEALERSYPEILDEQGRPQASSSGGGITGAAIGNAILSGTALSTVGVLGQTDAGAGIGIYGGAGIGAGSAILYGLNNPVSTADGTRYASSVGWGLANGVVLGSAMFYNDRGPAYDNRTALMRTVGVSLGAGQAWWAYQNNLTDVHNVWESNGAAWLGTGSALGLAIMATDGQAGDNGQALLFSASAGSITGLAAQAAIREHWDPAPPDIALASIVAFNGGWTAGWLPYVARDPDPVQGRVLFGTHATAAIGLGAAHVLEPTWKQDAVMLWGSALGYSLGAGVPLLVGQDDETVVQAMLPMGLFGAGAGYAMGAGSEWSTGDKTMLGVGVPVLTLQALGYGVVLESKTTGFDDTQVPGLMLVGLGASGLGLSALSQRWDPSAGQMLFMGTGALWGAWYGVLTPVALDLDGEAEDLLLITLLASDTGLIATGVGTYALGIEPRSTVAPQIGGLAGATVGSLGVGLVNGGAQPVAAGAVIGSVLGFVGGSIVETRVIEPRRAELEALAPGRPGRVDLPGTWSAAASPWADEQGDLGVYGTIAWRED